MHQFYGTALVIIALVVGSYLWKTGLGTALLAFPFGLRPMFPFRANVETIYGMNPETCQVKAFQAKHNILMQQAKASCLRYYNVYTVHKNFVRAMRKILPQMARMSAQDRVAALEMLAEELKRKEPHALFMAAKTHWRLILNVSSEHPSRDELIEAYLKSLDVTQKSPDAQDIVIFSMARACIELAYDYHFQ
jgi:hypothetical protein